MTSGNEDGEGESSGSDSAPSEDNLDEDEFGRKVKNIHLEQKKTPFL